MAYDIIGNVYRIGATENINTRNGSTLQRRSVTLCQKRFDQNTGEEFEPNYPTLEFTNKGCAELDKFKQGDRVRVRFDISGMRYNDRNTQEEKFFSSLRAFRIELYTPQQTQQPQQVQQPQPPQYQQPQQYAQVPPQYQRQPPQGQQNGDGNSLPF